MKMGPSVCRPRSRAGTKGEFNADCHTPVCGAPRGMKMARGYPLLRPFRACSAAGANPGLRSFLAAPWAGLLRAFGPSERLEHDPIFETETQRGGAATKEEYSRGDAEAQRKKNVRSARKLLEFAMRRGANRGPQRPERPERPERPQRGQPKGILAGRRRLGRPPAASVPFHRLGVAEGRKILAKRIDFHRFSKN
jgi:hypothetical protein